MGAPAEGRDHEVARQKVPERGATRPAATGREKLTAAAELDPAVAAKAVAAKAKAKAPAAKQVAFKKPASNDSTEAQAKAKAKAKAKAVVNVAAKKPASNDSTEPIDAESSLDGFRDRLKKRKFEELWEELPEAIQDAWNQATGGS